MEKLTQKISHGERQEDKLGNNEWNEKNLCVILRSEQFPEYDESLTSNIRLHIYHHSICI